jgi:Uma2 family endonuclease
VSAGFFRTGVVTVTDHLTHPEFGQPWTIDDLDKLPRDNGMRYEIVDGSLLVSPYAGIRHGRAANRLRRRLDAQTPAEFEAVQEVGVTIQRRRSYFVPDLFVVRTSAYERETDRSFDQADVVLAVEVLSPSNAGNYMVLKRHYYAAGGIPHYWIVDPDKRTLTVFALDGETLDGETLDGETYVERAVANPGEAWHTDEPFPLTLDPAEFL